MHFQVQVPTNLQQNLIIRMNIPLTHHIYFYLSMIKFNNHLLNIYPFIFFFPLVHKHSIIKFLNHRVWKVSLRAGTKLAFRLSFNCIKNVVGFLGWQEAYIHLSPRKLLSNASESEAMRPTYCSSCRSICLFHSISRH